MSNIPPPPPAFDIIKATFYLVAGVFAVYSAMLFIAMGICAYHADVASGGIMGCGKQGGILEALTTLLASALAFAAGRSSNK